MQTRIYGRETTPFQIRRGAFLVGRLMQLLIKIPSKCFRIEQAVGAEVEVLA